MPSLFTLNTKLMDGCVILNLGPCFTLLNWWPFVRLWGKPPWFGGPTTEQGCAHHYAMLFPLVPTSLLHFSDDCGLEKKNELITITVRVRRLWQPREATIADRVHYACDVNEVWAVHIERLFVIRKSANRGDGYKCFLFPSTVSTNGKNKHIHIQTQATWSSQLLTDTVVKYFQYKYILGRVCYSLLLGQKRLLLPHSEIRH